MLNLAKIIAYLLNDFAQYVELGKNHWVFAQQFCSICRTWQKSLRICSTILLNMWNLAKIIAYLLNDFAQYVELGKNHCVFAQRFCSKCRTWQKSLLMCSTILLKMSNLVKIIVYLLNDFAQYVELGKNRCVV
jgi:hypothetical protein